MPLCQNKSDIKRLSTLFDGYLFTGGGDIYPPFFNQQAYDFSREISFNRDMFEISLFRHLYSRNVPVLGICRGIQIFNVALGGDIYQDIKSERNLKQNIMHNQTVEDSVGVHTVNIDKNSKLHSIVQKQKLLVNSLHHQAIKTLSSQLYASSISVDNLVESVESRAKNFLLAVQWHPERMVSSKEQRSIFKAFIKSC